MVPVVGVDLGTRAAPTRGRGVLSGPLDNQRRRREREAASEPLAIESLASIRPNAVLIPALALDERGTVVRRLAPTER